MRRVRRRMPVRLHLALAAEQRDLSWQGAGQRKDLRRMSAMRRGLRMGRYLHHAHRPESGVPRIAWLPEWRRSGLSRGRSPRTDSREPARGSAFCFLKAALCCAAIVVILAILDADPASGAGANPIPPEVACAQIRDAVLKVATAERNQALALHLMADGKPTPLVQTRLT